MNERTPKDFAIEFGEYLAKAAEQYVESATLFRADGELGRERLRSLNSAIYEFRKRAERAS